MTALENDAPEQAGGGGSYFRLRKDARTFFKQIERQLSRQAPAFDMYYFCLVAGLATGRRVPDLRSYPATDLVDNFPGEYAGKAELIISLLLSTELERQGITLDDKPTVNQEVSRLLNPRSASYLSTDGLYAANCYAFAGCDVLRQEWYDEPPHSLEHFLLIFQQGVRSATL